MTAFGDSLGSYTVAIAALRLEGLLAGRFRPAWAGEIFWLLGLVYGAGE